MESLSDEAVQLALVYIDLSLNRKKGIIMVIILRSNGTYIIIIWRYYNPKTPSTSILKGVSP